jgi:NADPH-dependent 2,4-dienoyl-CoA reductase/sulfur reductase-like enzyme
MQNVVIIGGSDAGISAALRAQELSAKTSITVILRDDYPNFSVCGIPFYLSGEVPSWKDLAHRTREDIQRDGINLLPNTVAESIDPLAKEIKVRSARGDTAIVAYDKLVLGMGAISERPRIEGLNTRGVFFLRWIGEARAIHDFMEQNNPKVALLIGGGYINMEMADALTLRGIRAIVIEHNSTVLKTLDTELGQILEKHMNAKGVRTLCGVRAERIEPRQQGGIRADLDNGQSLEADFAIIAVGARPNTGIAATAGARCGPSGALKVNRRMETSLCDVYAGGDCVETHHAILRKDVYLPLGSTSHKQGRIAGENAVGGNAEYAGTLGTQVVKIFELVAARTGFKDSDAAQYGFDPLSVDSETWDHKIYYPDAKRLHIRLTGDRSTGKLLGAQFLGHVATEAAKRVDTIALALYAGMSVAGLNDVDLSYTPPLGSPWDPIQQAAQNWLKTAKT